MEEEGTDEPDKFCRGPFFDYNLTWNTTNPDLTPCMRDTVLVGIPSLFLWIVGPLWLLSKRGISGSTPQLTDSGNAFAPENAKLFWCKFLLALGLIGNAGLELAYRVQSLGGWHALTGSDLFMPICLMTTYLLIACMQCLERRLKIITSPPLFFFWLFLMLGYLPTFKIRVEEMLRSGGNWERLLFVVTATGAPLMLLQFILNCMADIDKETLRRRSQLSPEDLASFFSAIFFNWITPLTKRARSETLSAETLPPIIKDLDVSASVARLQNALIKETNQRRIYFDRRDGTRREKLRLWAVLIKTYGLEFSAFFCLLFLQNTVTFLQPMVLKLLIVFMSNEEDEQIWKGCLYVVLLFSVSMLDVLLFQHNFHRMTITCLKMQASLQSMIVRKSLRLSPRARTEFTSGQLINLMAVDTQKMQGCLYNIAALICIPYQVILAFYLLYNELGIAMLAGLAVILLIIPFTVVCGKFSKRYEKEQLRNKDCRMKIMNEILHGIKVLKLYAWEEPFAGKVNGIRDREIKTLKKLAATYSSNRFLGSLGPFLITISVFVTYILLDSRNVLTADKIFVSLALFNLLRVPMVGFPSTVFQAINWLVSVNRIGDFLNSEEINRSNDAPLTWEDNNYSCRMEDASFTWGEDSQPPFLKDLNLVIPKGSLTAVVGVVGSGKSSLISALLGEMTKVNGEAQVYESIAYVPQEAWIQNMTLKDNVLFSSQLQSHRYNSTLRACALLSDLKILPSGDETEIGENGINLSGGQKQRVSLARAVYSNSDLFLLDDPLSAVDSHVGKHIFERVLSNENGMLKDKTRLLVTHSVSFLDQVDKIVVMKDGRIAEMGTYSDLKKKEGAFADYINETRNNQRIEEGGMEEVNISPLDVDEEDTEEEVNTDQDEQNESEPLVEHAAQNRLVEDEKAMLGRVKWSVYFEYFRALTYPALATCVIVFLLGHAADSFGNYWLSRWADANGKNLTQSVNGSTPYYLGIYGAIGLASVILGSFRSLMLLFSAANASRAIHSQLLDRIMHCPMSFFDTNPSGRIMNRFSSDIDCVDQTIPMLLNDIFRCLLNVLFALIIVSYSTPFFMITIVPVIGCYAAIQQYYVPTARQLRRILSISKSPVLAKFSESIRGVTSIRAYRSELRFICEMEDKISTIIKCRQLLRASFRWLGTRNSILGNAVVLFASIFALVERGEITPGLAGLSITTAISLIGSFGWITRMICEFESNTVSLERIQEYCQVEQEAPRHQPDVDEELNSQWPENGQIVLKDYETRYRKGTDLALRGINLTVREREKLGICGRTGAGKSTFALALFRIMEPSAGSITIDGVDITTVGLHKLRSRLTIIPQEPILFTGSLRFNVDPSNEHSDYEILAALDHANLKDYIESLDEGLCYEVQEGGQNVSVGQRQLICLARALLKKTKILVLDEATASVDLETDALIQATIKKEFSDCTVLTVAHRLNTILDSNCIAVFKQGQMFEHNAPRKLLEDRSSLFYNLAIDAGIKL